MAVMSPDGRDDGTRSTRSVAADARSASRAATSATPASSAPASSRRAPRLRRADLSRPGLRRASDGRWHAETGRALGDAATLERLEALAIPPAWTDVWASPDPLWHIQATGLDAAGRRQYRYHPMWNERRGREKFERALRLAETLPAARRLVSRDLALEAFPPSRALAAAFRLLDVSALRIGHEEYLRDYGSRGVTTLLCRHVAIADGIASFAFPAKSGQRWRSAVRDERLVAYLAEVSRARAADRRLLAWRDRRWHAITPAQVNDYIRLRTGGGFTAKDFRTLHGTVTAAVELARIGPRRGRDATAAVALAVRRTAEALGNTPATARASYIDPRVIDRYLAGETLRAGRLSPERALCEMLGGSSDLSRPLPAGRR